MHELKEYLIAEDNTAELDTDTDLKRKQKVIYTAAALCTSQCVGEEFEHKASEDEAMGIQARAVTEAKERKSFYSKVAPHNGILDAIARANREL